MSDNLELPLWLSRGIEEYFPKKGTDQAFSEIIDQAQQIKKIMVFYLVYLGELDI